LRVGWLSVNFKGCSNLPANLLPFKRGQTTPRICDLLSLLLGLLCRHLLAHWSPHTGKGHGVRQALHAFNGVQMRTTVWANT
jgi:hypothetical protein